MMLAGGLHAGLSPEADPLNFVPRIKMPLLLSGRYDFGFPIGRRRNVLFNLLGTPAAQKRHVIFENTGHAPRGRT